MKRGTLIKYIDAMTDALDEMPTLTVEMHEGGAFVGMAVSGEEAEALRCGLMGGLLEAATLAETVPGEAPDPAERAAQLVSGATTVLMNMKGREVRHG